MGNGRNISWGYNVVDSFNILQKFVQARRADITMKINSQKFYLRY